MRFKDKIQEKQRLKVHQQDDSKKTEGLFPHWTPL